MFRIEIEHTGEVQGLRFSNHAEYAKYWVRQADYFHFTHWLCSL